MAAMLVGVLDLARLESGRALELEYARFDLAALLRQLVAEQQHAAPLHEFVLDAPATLLGLWDAARLERVLGSLLGNAVKYSPDGGEVRVTLAEGLHDGARWAVVTVTDQGVGIPEADLPRLFERFHRGSNVVGRISGVGVGLAAAKQIVDQHGGTIRIASSEGRGTTVTLRLPCAPAEPAGT
jgi:signal transduction histidine kinase